MQLPKEFPSAQSLYGILMRKGVVHKKKDPAFQKGKKALDEALSPLMPDKLDEFKAKVVERKEVYLKTLPASRDALLADMMKLSEKSAEQPYDILDTLKAKYPNTTLIEFLYDAEFSDRRTLLAIPPTAREFAARWSASAELVRNKLKDVAFIWMLKSFPFTYFHKGIADALAANLTLKNSQRVPERVLETARILAEAADESSGLLYQLAIGMMHAYRRSKYRKDGLYNAETVELTLLAFSAFGAEVVGFSDEKELLWFFYWRVFGSLMGLPVNHLHANASAAKVRMNAITNGMPKIVRDTKAAPDTRRELLEAFLGATFDLGKLVGLGAGDFTANAETTITEEAEKYASDHMKAYLSIK
jgi:hypothetical protein